MAEVIVGVVLTAVLGGLLTPYLKGVLDRRGERFRASTAQVDTLAASLWAYWKLAVRVAYYGKEGRSKDLEDALENWHSEKSWQMGGDLQIQISKSKRLFPPSVHEELDRIQKEFVEYLDTEIDQLLVGSPAAEWKVFFTSLTNEKRQAIDSLLTDVMRSLKIDGTPNRVVRLYHRIRDLLRSRKPGQLTRKSQNVPRASKLG